MLNVVAHEVREKLKLSTTMDPRPYNVVWVNDPTIPVTGWCLVTFKIGNSKDVVQCHSNEHHSFTHILLGMPWLYDPWAHNDEVVNTELIQFTVQGVENHSCITQVDSRSIKSSKA